MDRPELLLSLLALGALLLWQALRLRNGARARAQQRAAFLDTCRPLFADIQVRIEPDGFPRLAGTHGESRFDLRVVPDTLTTRKLPALWLLVTMAEPQALSATWHLMLRPRGTETFSSFDRLPRALPPRPDLPLDSALRTDAPSGARPPLSLAPVVAALGEDLLKEVIVSPKGLRLTVLLDEAHRGRYLLFRDAEMGREPLSPDRLRLLLDTLLALRDDLRPERLRA
jgi:hypothetical protein